MSGRGTTTDPRLMTPRWDAAREPSRRRLYLLLAIALPLAAWYFGWLLQPERVGNPWLFGLLVAAELFNVAQAAGFWWTIRRRARRRATGAPVPGAVDVFVPVYDEPVGVVKATVQAASRIRGEDVRVHLLDDGARDEMRDLAQWAEVGYMRRNDNEGAKAGNINAALERTSAPYVLVLDSDHVARRRFLERTMPEFADERVAFVQTPQYYGNERQGGVAAAAWAQQALFFGAIARGKDAQGAMFCCGTNVVFRRAALEEAGGFPTNSVTEDFELSLQLAERGWETRYVPEVLAVGLGPEDMSSWVSQQQRWARGCLGAVGSALRARLGLRKRLHYLLSSMYFLSGWTLLAYMSFPVVRILTGEQPIAAAGADQFLFHFAPYFTVALAMVAVAGVGAYSFSGFALAASGFWIHIQASLRALARRPARFVVTPKEGSARRQPRAVLPALGAMAILCGVGTWGLANDASPSTLNNVAFAGLHVAVLAAGVRMALTRVSPRRRGAAPEESPAPAVHGPEPKPALLPKLGRALAAVGATALIGAAAVSGFQITNLEGQDSQRANPAAHFFSRYVEDDGRVSRSDQGGDTVSEGQAYAMLLAVAQGDATMFERVWGWTKDNLQRPDGLLAYAWRDGGVTVRQPATDADLDAAWALLLAAERFDQRRYRREAIAIGNAILARETTRWQGQRVLIAGPWADRGEPTVNPSYFSPGAYEALHAATGKEAWRELAASSRAIVEELTASRPGLPPDWAALTSGGEAKPTVLPDEEGDPGFSFDAVRTQIRAAASCSPADRRLAARSWPLLRREAKDDVHPDYALDGTPRAEGTHPAPLVSAAAAATAAGDDRSARTLLKRAARADGDDPTYYGAAWVALGDALLRDDALTGCGNGGKS